MSRPAQPPAAPAVMRPTMRFMLSHPAHLIALGFGSGLSPVAPGTAGTLWAWLAWLVLQQWLSPAAHRAADRRCRCLSAGGPAP